MATTAATTQAPRATEARARVRVRPTRSGIVAAGLAAVILAAALNTGNNLLYLLSALIAVSLPVSWRLAARSLRAVRVELLPPREVTAGEPAEAALRVRAEGRALTGLRLRLRGGASAACPFLEAGRSRVLALPLEAARRGPQRLRLLLECVFPWGLAVARREGPEAELLVLPRPLAGAAAPASLGLVPDGKPSRLPGPGQDLLEIRDYRPGDDARRMDWKATARRERPMVRQGAREEERRATVVIDPSPAGDDEAARERVEDAISRAAGALADLSRAGWQLRLVHPGGESRAGELLEQLRVLARLQVPEEPLEAGWWRDRVPAGEPLLVCRAESP